MLTLDNELCLLEKYKLTPTELFTVKVILLAKEEGEYEPLKRFASILNGELRLEIEKLKSKGIILASYKIPAVGTPFIPEDVEFNKNFIKQLYRSSFEMGEELFNAYPQFLVIQGVTYNARRVSKKFNDLEDAFFKYGKAIKYNDKEHQQILCDIKKGIESNYNFTTLDDFICDRGWTALNAFLNGEGVNINNDAVKMI